MLDFDIPNISCGHCVRAVTEAVHAADPKAQVQVDLATRHVSVSTDVARAALVAQLVEAGYPPA